MQNISPWIKQLKLTYKHNVLDGHQQTDIAIVGAGIAGITTAYFTLKNTNKSIILLESSKIAHGATGHNAGQIVSYFERQISELVKEFGLSMAAKGQDDIYSAWGLLEDIYQDVQLQTPLAQFTGYAGCQDLAEILVHLENNWVSREANINMEPLMVADIPWLLHEVSQRYDGLYSVLPHGDIMTLLETKNPAYIAALSARKGCMNSALFCEELLEYLMKTYPERITVFEESHVKEVFLDAHQACLKVGEYDVIADKVVLCTNGFEKFTITNLVGDDINTNFHHFVKGAVGYMAAYLEEHTKSPIAVSYLPKRTTAGEEAVDSDPYFYLTRRTFEMEENQQDSLICIGGPESLMDDTNNYLKEHPYSEEAQKTIDTFLHKSYAYAPKGEIDYTYRWHGLMGYTPNGVRCIGAEPINPVLLYNLGCNGVGILPSIYGGMRISRLLREDVLEKSIFDPQDSRQKKKDSTPSINMFSVRRLFKRLFATPD